MWESQRSVRRPRVREGESPTIIAASGPGRSLTIYPSRIYRPRMTGARNDLPLTPAVFHILLALSSGDRHGYAIMKQVDADSQGRVSMGPGTLYGSLKRMLDAGLVVESGERIEPAIDDKRRIYYAITGAGSEALGAELERYRRLVELTTDRGMTPITLADG